MGRYDTIIVGASYAGLACACQLPGRRVLLLERHDSVVHKHRGCLGLYLPVGNDIEVRGDGVYLHGLDLMVEGGLRGRIERIEIRGHRERTIVPLGEPIALLDERRIKGALLRRALDLGAEVRVATPVREVHTDGREARVRADEEHRARVLVGADGSQSLVAHSLNLSREKLAVLFQREAETPDRLDVSPGTLLVQVDDDGVWYLAVPTGDRFLVMVLQMVGPKGVPADLDVLLQDKVERLGGGRVKAKRVAIVRIMEPSPVSYRDNVVLTGDALATFNLATIAGALTQGTLAGAAINRLLSGSVYALPDYHSTWRKATSQSRIEKLRWLAPVAGRIRAHRMDRALQSLRRSGNITPGSGSFWLHLPGLLLRLLA